MRRHRNDPYCTRAKFPGKCHKCAKTITKGQEIFYYPQSRTVYCDGDKCGQAAAREFTVLAADEDFYNRY